MPKPYWGAKGEDSRTAKLNENKVLEIKMMLRDGATQRDVAKAFGIAVSTVNSIANNRSWQHVKLPK